MDIVWCQGEVIERVCPVCGDKAPKRGILKLPHKFFRTTITLLSCASCACAFYDDLRPGDYHSRVTPEHFVRLYIEQGAGIASMVQPALRFMDMPIEHYAEIGGGFGFGLDFARYLFGCSVLGVDPSNMAERGGRELNIDVRTEYVTTEKPLAQPVDLLMASEVIEHIPEPHGFLSALTSSLAPRGVLALTTPNIQGVGPSAPLAILMPVLSPGGHLVLFSAKGLSLALQRAGFAHVQVREHTYSLVAYASRQPLPPPPADASRGPKAMMHYHLDKAHRSPLGSPLQIGHLGRLLPLALEMELDYVFKAALDDLRAAVKHAHGFDLADMAAIEARLLGDAEVSAVASRLPLNLTPVLFLLARIRKQAGLFQAAIPVFDLARRVGFTIRRALTTAGIDDGDTDHYLRTALIEELDCRMRGDRASVIPRVDDVLALSQTPDAALLGCGAQNVFELVRNLAEQAFAAGDAGLGEQLIGRLSLPG